MSITTGAGITFGAGIELFQVVRYAYQFNGASWLNVLGNLSDWNLGTTWTIEWWTDASASTLPNNIFTTLCQGPGAGIDMFYQAGNLVINNGTTVYTEPTFGLWTHVAIVQVAGVITAYYNGVSVATFTLNYNLTDQTDYLTVGRRGNNNFQYFNGMMSDIRINNTAVYTTNFTPTLGPLTDIPGTVLLISGPTLTDLANRHTIQSNGVTVINAGPY